MANTHQIPEDFENLQGGEPSHNRSDEDLEDVVQRLMQAAINYHPSQKTQRNQPVNLKVVQEGDVEILFRDDDTLEDDVLQQPNVIEISDDEDTEEEIVVDEEEYNNLVTDEEVSAGENEHNIEEVASPTYVWASDILPMNPNYQAIPLAEKQGDAEKKNPFLFPTQLIPVESTYWSQYLTALQSRTVVKERSVYDGAMVSAIKFSSGRVKASRNYVNVILRQKKKTILTRNVNVFQRNEIEVINGIFPTDMIPVRSPYYITLIQDLYFPLEHPTWVRKRGEDDVEVKFRLGVNGKSLYAKRNGITVKIHPLN